MTDGLTTGVPDVVRGCEADGTAVDGLATAGPTPRTVRGLDGGRPAPRPTVRDTVPPDAGTRTVPSMEPGVLVRATEERYILAEGPTWDPVRNELLWVDIEAGLVLAGDLGSDGRVRVGETVSVGETVGGVAVAETGEWVILGRERLHVRSSDGTVGAGLRVLPPGSGSRLNDGRPDPAGRLVVGTCCLASAAEPAERLCIVRGGAVEVIDADLTLSNGLAWTADGRTLYSVDTLRRVIFRRDWEPATSTWGERTELLRLEDGYPDGMCIDAAGHLWVAVWGLGQVRRYGPDGTLAATIEVPAPYVSSVAFAGPDLDILVITTSLRDHSDEERARHPSAGSLFTIRPGVTGLQPRLVADVEALGGGA